ncbi:cation transporter [Cohnella xylanilytica]|nr:cation transporter [Cohnella xylanilytica]
MALLSDSGHMLSDVTALALSLLAARFATRPASPSKTYGYHRFEILAALLNGVALFVVAGFIAWEAVGRLFEPPEVSSLPMMAIAAVGLLANLASAWALMSKGDVKNNVNLRSAYLHVLSDALGSIGAIAAGLVIYAFGWTIADPIISVVVAVLILRSAWGVIKNTLHVLMEGAPGSIDHRQVKEALASLEGVMDVHDLHIWTITSGMDSISCHLRIEDQADGQRLLQQAIRLLEERFGVLHATVQIEDSRVVHAPCKV